MTKPPEIYLKHMLMAIEEVESYLKGYTRNSFQKDSKTISAIIRQLEIIGEAAGHIPKEQVSDSPIDWKKITGMRNKLIHEYFGVDVEVVWKTATEGLSPLKHYLKKKISE